MSPDEIMGMARLIVRAKVPYLRPMLLQLVPHEVEGLGTMAVSKRGVLLYDPAFVAAQDAPEVAFVLCHEIMHLLLKHGDRVGDRDPGLFNLAGDLAINPSVLEMGFDQPKGVYAGVFPKNHGFDEGLLADEYYRLLLEKQEKQQKKNKGGEGDGEKGEQHKCGGCSGNPVEGEPKEGDAKAEQGRTEAQIARAVKHVAESVRNLAQKGRGSVPQGLARWADSILEPPKVPWRSKLSRALRSAVAYRAGAVVHRYDGPSRRQAGIGYGAGKPVLPRMRHPVPRVALVADTSGSMGAVELGIALREAKGILSAVGADVTFVACDAAVHGGAKQVRNVNDLAKLLVGGGGTNFTPALETLAKQRPAPELIVVATDGDGTCPPAAPRGIKVIWLLTGKYRREPCSWGEMIHIED